VTEKPDQRELTLTKSKGANTYKIKVWIMLSTRGNTILNTQVCTILKFIL